MILEDTSPMPFGKYKNRPMQDVPCEYLHYLWVNGMKKEQTPVANYIRKNVSALALENPDLIWL